MERTGAEIEDAVKSDWIPRVRCHLKLSILTSKEETLAPAPFPEALSSTRRVAASVWAQMEDLVKTATTRPQVRGCSPDSRLSKFVCRILIRVHTGRGVN